MLLYVLSTSTLGGFGDVGHFAPLPHLLVKVSLSPTVSAFLGGSSRFGSIGSNVLKLELFTDSKFVSHVLSGM